MFAFTALGSQDHGYPYVITTRIVFIRLGQGEEREKESKQLGESGEGETQGWGGVRHFCLPRAGPWGWLSFLSPSALRPTRLI